MKKNIVDYSSMEEVRSFRLNSDLALAYLREHTPFVGELITLIKGELEPKDEFNLRFYYYSKSLEKNWKKHDDGLSLDSFADVQVCNSIYSTLYENEEKNQSVK